MKIGTKGFKLNFFCHFSLYVYLLMGGAFPSFANINQGNSASSNQRTIEPQLVIYFPGFDVYLSGNLNFPELTVGTKIARTLNIINVGSGDLYVSRILCPPGFSASWFGTIRSGKSQGVPITFEPTAPTNYSGTITVECGNYANTISATGTGKPAPTHIIALSGNLEFGKVEAGTVAQSFLNISNAGNSTVRISGILYPSAFSGSWKGDIAAGTSQPVAVKFKPTGLRSYQGEIKVMTAATLENSAPMPSGTGFVRPALKITVSPAQRPLTNAITTAKGTVEYAGKLLGVWYQINGGEWSPAQSTNHWKNWDATLVLTAGVNVLNVYAQGVDGVCSATNRVSFTSPHTFKLLLSCLGTDRAPANGLTLNLQTSSNLTGHIQYSTNLVDWLEWTNFTGRNSSATFCDRSATNSARRFYRAVIP